MGRSVTVEQVQIEPRATLQMVLPSNNSSSSSRIRVEEWVRRRYQGVESDYRQNINIENNMQ
jgi:hypothetical protein